jgi:hydroxymethylpyrimidine pyrophosphatase-like HAD family hydrolase
MEDLMPAMNSDNTDKYVQACLKVKEITKRSEKILLKNSLTNSLKVIYRAIALDIDGTLSEDGKSSIDPEVVSFIKNYLLLNGVLVLLISSRGPEKAAKIAMQIVTQNEENIWYYQRLHCCAYNGAILLSTPPMSLSYSNLFSIRESLCNPINNPEEFREDLYKNFSAHFPDVNWNENTHVGTHRISLKTNGIQAGNIVAIRISLDKLKPDQIEQAFQLTNQISEKYKNRNDLYITKGIYGKIVSINITHGCKCEAIEMFGNQYGITKEQILRIGDHGSEGDNNFDMLNSEAGFSVGRFSRAPDKCFPVINEETGNQLFGSQGFMHLLNNVCILSPISLDTAAFSNPIAKKKMLSYFSKFKYIATNRAKAETIFARDQLRICLRNLFPSISAKVSSISIDDIFDKHSGGVLFRNMEIGDLYKNNEKIVSLFEIPLLNIGRVESVKSPYSRFTDTGLLMRGSLYYFGMVDNYINTDVTKYISMAVIFVEKCLQGLDILISSQKLLSSYKLLLFMLDNVRNILLQTTNIFFQIDFPKELVSPNKKNRPKIIFDNFLCPHTEILYNILTDDHAVWERTINEYKELLGAIKSWLSSIDNELLKPLQCNGDITKEQQQIPIVIRKWRECDFFYQNVAAIQLIIRDSNCPPKPAGGNALYAVGLAYGGLELPAIATVVGNRYGYDIRPGLMRISIYNDNDNSESARAERIEIIKQIRTASPKYIENLKNSSHPLTLLDGREIAGSNILLLDDNCTTGITLQVARDYIYLLNGNFKGAGIVRIPGIDRREQMAFAGNGFPDPEILFALIRGFIPTSP